MNFCKENDEFISLYIDEMLEDDIKTEFLTHTQKCSECSAKLKEALYFAQLCREDQDIKLPEDFSISLHKRLIEVSSKENKSKLGFFLYNKKLIASLSTAAILVISLIAYSLLPQFGTKQSTASKADETAQIEASSAIDDNYTSSEDTSIMAKSIDQSANQDSTVADTQAGNKEIVPDVSADINRQKVAPQINKRTIEPSNKNTENGSEASSSNTNDSNKKEIQSLMLFQEDKADLSNMKYYLNYAELNMIVTPAGIEIDNLRKLMNEFGAFEAEPATIYTSLQKPQFLDYYLPISLYSTLESQTEKYKLDLETKTDLISNDITDKYNELNVQKTEIDKQIDEAIKKGEDTTNFDSKKTSLIEAIDKIITESELVRVRIFLIYK